MDGLTAAPRIWITRAEPGAARTAARLRDRGYDPLVAPLIATRPLPFASPSPDAVDALAFTSAAGVAAFAPAADATLRAKPAFAVGDATAAAARIAGFADVRSASGGGVDLAALIAAACPRGARVLHPAAARPAFDLAAALTASGFIATHLPVYETAPAATPPEAALEALVQGDIRAVLIHSPAAARVLRETMAACDAAATSGMVLVALSAACAAPLDQAGFASRHIAAEPTEDALLAALAAAVPPLRPSAAPAEPSSSLADPAPRR